LAVHHMHVTDLCNRGCTRQSLAESDDTRGGTWTIYVDDLL